MDYTLPNLPYAYDALIGISEKVNKWHHDKHYASYVDGRNAVEATLSKMRETSDWSSIRGTMLAKSHHVSGSILHKNYYEVMGGNGEFDSNLDVVDRIEKDFGSFETWKKEFIEVAKVARGWAVLSYDISDGKLHNAMVDFHDQQVPWGFLPILALDVWEHAYYYDYGPDRGKYLDVFFENVDWGKVNGWYEKFKSVRV